MRLKWAQERDSFRPQNMTKSEFFTSPDLEYVWGPFSTFDPILSRMVQFNTMASMIESYAIRQINNIDAVSREYADAMAAILTENLIIHNKMQRYGLWAPSMVFTPYLQTIITELAHKLNISHIHMPHVIMIDSWDLVPAQLCPPAKKQPNTHGIYINLSLFGENTPYKSIIIIHRKNIAQDANNNPQDFFFNLMNTLAHEFSHHVDHMIPNRGAAGSQKVAIGHSIHDIVEYSAHTIGNAVEQKLKAIHVR